MEFSGNITVEKPVDDVYSFLNDPVKLATIAPDREGEVEDADGEARFIVKAGVSFIKGKFNVKLGIGESNGTDHVEVKGTGSGKGSSMDLIIKCDLNPSDNLSEINWVADINIRGTLATVGNRLIQGAAKKYIDRTIDALREGITNSP